MTDDGPADERCETCHRLDPINCPCPEETPLTITPDAPTLHAVHMALVTLETAPALVDVADERVRQVAKWGVQTRPDGTSTRFYAAQRDVAQAHTDWKAQRGDVTWRDILDEEVLEAFAEEDPARLREELVQVAAVALSWVEDIDRKDAVAPARVIAAWDRPDADVIGDLTREADRAYAEGLSVDAAIADGRLPLRSPGAAS